LELIIQIKCRNFVSEIVKIESDDDIIRLPIVKSRNFMKKKKTRGNDQIIEQLSDLPHWLTDSVQLNISDLKIHNKNSSNGFHHSISIIAVFYKNLAIFMPQRFLERRE
jgi:hypothetical protein